MDKKIKTEWVEALRSGKYAQGKFKLKSKEGYCCLGVLGELNAIVTKLTMSLLETQTQAHYTAINNLISSDEKFAANCISTLVSMNDDNWAHTSKPLYNPPKERRQYSFAEIADWIEKNIPETEGEPAN